MTEIDKEEFEPIKLATLSRRELIAKIRPFLTTIESLQEKADEFEERYTDSQFHVKALSDVEGIHLAQIKSQKEEIEKWRKEAFANHPTQWAYDQACAALNDKRTQVESLKAITELAVKAIGRVIEGDFIYLSAQRQYLKNTLSEIERLQNDPIS